MLGAAQLLAGTGPALLDDVWARRDSIRLAGLERAVDQRAIASAWWDAVADAAQTPEKGYV